MSNSKQIRNEINNIVGKGALGQQINQYISTQLSGINGILSMNKINSIIEPLKLNLLKGTISKNINSSKQLLFFLTENIPLGKTFSFFDPSINENKSNSKGKVVMPKGMSRTWNIFNDDKFELLKDKLRFINNHPRELDYVLEKEKFDQYTYSFNFGENNTNLKELIDNLINSSNIIEREMNIYNFIKDFGAMNPFKPSFYENSNRVSYGTIGKGNNRDHAFTYLFEKLYESIEDKIWSDSIKAYKANIRRNINKNLNDKKKISKIRGLIKNLNKNDKYYDSKLKFLKVIQYPIITRIKNSKLTGKQRKQKNKNTKKFGKKANPTLGNVVKSIRNNKKNSKANANLNKASSSKLNA